MKQYLCIIFLLVLAVSCSSDKKSGDRKVTAKSQSAPYELLVVGDKEWLKTQNGEMFIDAVAGPIEGLPQSEPAFRVTTLNAAAFKGTFRTYSNIVEVKLSKQCEKAMVSVANDVYCAPQQIVTFEAPNEAALMEFVTVSGVESVQKVVDMLNEQEFARERKLLKKHYSNVVMNEVKKMFGAGIYAPSDIDEVKKGKDFLWGSAGKQEFRLNVCVYALPLKDMDGVGFVMARDSVMKINIPGSREDQWMVTDARTVTLRLNEHEGKELLEVRGLWAMRNDAMGGPFVAYVQSDEANSRLLVTEGFVFAPEEKKRPLIRELEAMLQTMIIK